MYVRCNVRRHFVQIFIRVVRLAATTILVFDFVG